MGLKSVHKNKPILPNLDCRVERESAWTRKRSTVVRSEEVYKEALEFHTVAGIIPEGERWEKQKKQLVEDVEAAC